MAETNLTNIFDARVWAKEFCKINPTPDEATMIAWFANAIMAGYDHAKQENAAIRKECADREAQLLDAAKAFQELATCYRIGKRPTEKLFARLEKANAAIMGDEK